MDGKDKDELELHDVDFESLELLLHYGYTGTINITDQNVQSLFITADYLQMPFVKASCEQFMIQNLNKDNCLTIFQFAAFYSLTKLKEACSQVIGRNLHCTCKMDNFLDLPYDILLEILNDDHLVVFKDGFPMCHVDNELTIFGAALGYISEQNQPEKLREEDIQKLLTAARLSRDSEELREIMKPHEHLLPQFKHPMAFASDAERSRSVTASYIIPNHLRFSIGGEVSPVLRRFDGKGKKMHYETKRLSKINFVTRIWDGWTVVGGIHVFDGEWHYHGLKPGENGACSNHLVELAKSEVIVKIIVRYGWVINCLTVVTNSGRSLGPFGGDVGGKVNVAEPPKDSKGFLHSFSGAEVKSQGCLIITSLGINWTCFAQK